MRQALAQAIISYSLLIAGGALSHPTVSNASVFIKPIYSGDQRWTGEAKVSFWNDGKNTVSISYPVDIGCLEAKDHMISAKAGNPGAGPFGKHQTMNYREVNSLIRELSNSPPVGFHKLGRFSGSEDIWNDQLTAIPYLNRPYICGTSDFPGNR